MSDFKQAIKWLNEGKKVRRSSWKNLDCFIYAEKYLEPILLAPSGREEWFGICDFEATDWEIYEEKKDESLSDKIYKSALGAVRCPDSISTEDVKEKIQNAQKRLKDLIVSFVYGDNPPHFSVNEDNIEEYKEEQNKIFKEEFGDKLTE